MDRQPGVVLKACSAFLAGNEESAKQLIEEKYPHHPITPHSRKYTALQSTRVFVRDGFIDRYSGNRLVFPPVLRALSMRMPDAFPFHKNWKMTDCHIAYWHLCPTIDHVVPVARGGEDKQSNWVTTSMMMNSAKSNWLLSELGWQLHPRGRLEDWDGLLEAFLEIVDKCPEFLSNSYIRRWHKAAVRLVRTQQITLAAHA